MWGGRKLALGMGAETAGGGVAHGVDRPLCSRGVQGGGRGVGNRPNPQIPNRCICYLVSEQGLLGNSCLFHWQPWPWSVCFLGPIGGNQLTAPGMIPGTASSEAIWWWPSVSFPKVGRGGGREMLFELPFFSFIHSPNKLAPAVCHAIFWMQGL